jgi:hypothetical protein
MKSNLFKSKIKTATPERQQPPSTAKVVFAASRHVPPERVKCKHFQSFQNFYSAIFFFQHAANIFLDVTLARSDATLKNNFLAP